MSLKIKENILKIKINLLILRPIKVYHLSSKNRQRYEKCYGERSI